MRFLFTLLISPRISSWKIFCMRIIPLIENQSIRLEVNMSQDQSIFSIKFEKYTAELEISESTLRCVTGDIIHFDIPMEQFRAYVQISHNTVLFSFYQSKLKQITITSKHCISILKYLDSLVKSA